MNFDWPIFISAFLASFVEFVEALTIVLAVGAVRGWRVALTGAGAAALTLAGLILLFGLRLAHLDIPAFKIVVGTLLLLFGLRWLRKAILRASGVIALHDEAGIYEKERTALEQTKQKAGFDYSAALTAFNGVFIEGIEVVFIVLAVGAATHKIMSASAGAGVAAVLVVLLGVIARHPLTKIPENALKLAVGVLVSAFGTFWIGEGIHLRWPWGDFSLTMLAAAYTVVAICGVFLIRRMKLGSIRGTQR